jgi:hypothetical protein
MIVGRAGCACQAGVVGDGFVVEADVRVAAPVADVVRRLVDPDALRP